MLENNNLIQRTIEVYDDLKRFRMHISNLTDCSDEKAFCNALCEEYNSFVSYLSDETFNKITEIDPKINEKLIYQQILNELDKALALFNADAIEKLRNTDNN